MAARQGLMLALMEPPPGLEEEFSDWYDTEHLPQRRGLPGFLTAGRWVATEGFPRSLAAYDLTALAALDDPAYRAVSGANSTPWSKRLLARTARAGRMRVEVEQFWPGNQVVLPGHSVSRLLVARYAGLSEQHEAQAIAEAQERAAAACGVGQFRLFASKPRAAPEFWALVLFTVPTTLSIVAPLLGQLVGQGADVFNLYLPYDKSGSF